MQTCSAARRATAASGFTYIGLLIFLAIMALTTTASLQVGSVLGRRDGEEELLAMGMQFQAALISYANATPAGQSRSPHTLEDMLRDARYPGVRRYLRKVPADPLTGQAEWGLVRGPDGGIVGIHSLADGKPLKIGNFDRSLHHFTGATSYRDWVIMLPTIVQGSAPNTPPTRTPAIPPPRDKTGVHGRGGPAGRIATKRNRQQPNAGSSVVGFFSNASQACACLLWLHRKAASGHGCRAVLLLGAVDIGRITR